MNKIQKSVISTCSVKYTAPIRNIKFKKWHRQSSLKHMPARQLPTGSARPAAKKPTASLADETVAPNKKVTQNISIIRIGGMLRPAWLVKQRSESFSKQGPESLTRRRAKKFARVGARNYERKKSAQIKTRYGPTYSAKPPKKPRWKGWRAARQPKLVKEKLQQVHQELDKLRPWVKKNSTIRLKLFPGQKKASAETKKIAPKRVPLTALILYQRKAAESTARAEKRAIAFRHRIKTTRLARFAEYYRPEKKFQLAESMYSSMPELVWNGHHETIQVSLANGAVPVKAARVIGFGKSFGLNKRWLRLAKKKRLSKLKKGTESKSLAPRRIFSVFKLRYAKRVKVLRKSRVWRGLVWRKLYSRVLGAMRKKFIVEPRRTMKWRAADYQLRIFGLYRKLTRQLLHGRYRKINKHRFFMKYFRVFFKRSTGYEEPELRDLWMRAAAKGRLNAGNIIKSVQYFSESIRLRLDSLVVALRLVSSLIAAKEFASSGYMLINGFQYFNPAYSIHCQDIIQFVPKLAVNSSTLSHGWAGQFGRKLRKRFHIFGFFTTEWAISAVEMFRWPRDYELPPSTQVVLSDRWLRFYIRFLMPVKSRKWKPTKLWWDTYRLNPKIFLRGYPKKYTGAQRHLREKGLWSGN
jgi:hypothetical protein